MVSTIAGDLVEVFFFPSTSSAAAQFGGNWEALVCAKSLVNTLSCSAAGLSVFQAGIGNSYLQLGDQNYGVQVVVSLVDQGAVASTSTAASTASTAAVTTTRPATSTASTSTTSLLAITSKITTTTATTTTKSSTTTAAAPSISSYALLASSTSNLVNGKYERLPVFVGNSYLLEFSSTLQSAALLKIAPDGTLKTLNDGLVAMVPGSGGDSDLIFFFASVSAAKAFSGDDWTVLTCAKGSINALNCTVKGLSIFYETGDPTAQIGNANFGIQNTNYATQFTVSLVERGPG